MFEQCPEEVDENRFGEIKMSDCQSKSLNLIKDAINRGQQITHILNVKITNEPNNHVGTKIREFLYQMINGSAKTLTINDFPSITLTWLMPTSKSSCYYYTNSIYNDYMTAEHTKNMLRSMINALKNDAAFNSLRTCNGYHSNWGISFFLTKPLQFGILQDSTGIIQ
jgi:hypothetical protein